MRILCVSVIRNEGPFLLEWLAHLKGAGVSDFLIYSNDCEDGSDVMLERLHKAGVLEHVPQSVPGGESVQWAALKAAWRHPLRKACDWALVCDIDEFPNIHCPGHSLAALIDRLPEAAQAVTLPWRLFGHNGQVAFADTPVTQTFTSAMPAECQFPVAATFFKTLFRLDDSFRQFGIHRPKQKPDLVPHWVDGSGRALPEVFAAAQNRLSLYGHPIGRELVELNHYSLKSVESFLVKRARGLPNRSEKAIDLAYWVERNFNSVEDSSISAMRPATEQHLKELASIPGIEDLHQQAVAWHREKVQTLLLSEDEHRLYGALMMAADSQVLSPETTREMVALYQKVLQAKQG